MSWAARILGSSPSVGPVRLVCIDGPAGSGKTTLAATLAAELALVVGEVAVVHGDEIYEGWPVVADSPDRVAAFGRLGGRLDTWLLTPWSSGLAGAHPVWDWSAGRWGTSRVLAPAPVAILEGVALGSRELRARAVLSVWVEADHEVCLTRVLDRDGEQLRAEMRSWQVDEARWHTGDATRRAADVRVRT
jgi:uridine kinase